MSRTKSERAIERALWDLLSKQPFFGTLALRLRHVEDPSCQTAWTDGETLGYNPEFVESLPQQQLVGLIAHEVLHCSNGHPWRRDAREPKRWNVACDHAINPIVRQASMDLPPGGLEDPQYAGLSAEAIYRALPSPPPDGESGDGSGDSGSAGEVRDAPAGTDSATMEADWQAAVVQAAHEARQRGCLPAGLDRLLAAIERPACRDLIAAMLEWAQRTVREDYSWRRPNARYAPHGLYLPTLHSQSTPPIVACVDTSGSIEQTVLSAYVAALQAVLDAVRPDKLIVLCADAQVASRAEFEPGDLVAVAPKGGGGTDFRPALVEAAEAEPAGVIYLTDLDGAFPSEAPEFPVLWVVADPGAERPQAPFGEVIWLA